jgi:predicted ester cyclase
MGMNVEDNKVVARRMFAALQAHDLDTAVACVAEDFVSHGHPLRGRAELRERLARNHAAFPDLRLDIQDLFGEGDRLVVRMAWRGAGAPGANGGSVIEILRFVDGIIAESWAAAAA